MKKTAVFFFIIFVFQHAWPQPRPAKLSSTVIIDTDCGFDDMRAISLILARPEITVQAITTTDGSLRPFDGAEKVTSLLREFRKEGIPVVYGQQITGLNPPWRQFNMGIAWGLQPGKGIAEAGAPDYLLKVLKTNKGKITLVCLGPLSNIAGTINKDQNVLSKIDRIIWYNESVRPFQGFNYECDMVSADLIFKSGVRIDVISNLNEENSLFDASLASLCRQSGTQLATVLNTVFSQKTVAEALEQNHSRLNDDLVALYLTNPELFGVNTDLNRLNVRYNTEYDVHSVKEAIGDMIKGIYVSESNVVFNGFPTQRELFAYDVRPIIDSAIARYGSEEWKANVMTDEFHGHLGIFSIVGAKMGIKARELFGVGPDMLEVTTFAGTTPPYSCLTDGIQVSTGATLGMGTIRLASGTTARPSAIFKYQDRSVRITLKEEFLVQVDKDINEGILKFGLMDDGYWKLIRQNALKYWLEWERDRIFDIEEISNSQE